MIKYPRTVPGDTHVNETRKSLVRHILTRMVTNIINELTEHYAGAPEATKRAYVTNAAMYQVVELLRVYEADLVREALRQWMIELEVLDFLLNLHSRFKWLPIRYLGILFALVRYGKERVENAIRIGETIART